MNLTRRFPDFKSEKVATRIGTLLRLLTAYDFSGLKPEYRPGLRQTKSSDSDLLICLDAAGHDSRPEQAAGRPGTNYPDAG